MLLLIYKWQFLLQWHLADDIKSKQSDFLANIISKKLFPSTDNAFNPPALEKRTLLYLINISAPAPYKISYIGSFFSTNSFFFEKRRYAIAHTFAQNPNHSAVQPPRVNIFLNLWPQDGNLIYLFLLSASCDVFINPWNALGPMDIKALIRDCILIFFFFLCSQRQPS